MPAFAVPPLDHGRDGPEYLTTMNHVLEPALDRLRYDDTTIGYAVGSTTATFGDVGRVATATARLLARRTRRRDLVGLLGHPDPAWIGGAIGVLASDRILVPLDESLAPGELRAMVARAGVTTVLAAPGCPISGPNTIAVPSRHDSLRPPTLELEGGGDDVAVVLHTSGSTGRPKGVMLTHRNLVQSLHSFVDVFGCTTADRTCVAVPLVHVTGFVDQFLQMLWLGGFCRLLPSRNTAAMISSLVVDEITVMIAVPTVFTLLTMRPPRTPLSLRLAVYGGAPMPMPTVEALVRLVPGIRPIQGYGLTEITSLATAVPATDALRVPSSVGLPTSITQLRVAAPDGAGVAPGALGEILLRGPHRTPGYLGDHDATRAAIDDEGWLHTGDIAWRDDGGFLYLAGRSSEIINRGGEKVSPREIETVLCGVRGVLDAVAFALPDDVLYQVPAAVVVADPQEGPTEADLRQALDDELAHFKHPVTLLRLEQLPLAPTGKPDLDQLRRLAMDHYRRCR